MTRFSITACLLLLISCSGPDTNRERNTSSVLLENKTTHIFSNPQQPDQFRVQLVGRDITSASVRLSIVTAAGDTIWNESFPAMAFINDKLQPLKAAQQEYITKRINTFFLKEWFVAQAISEESVFDPEFNGNQQQWQEIKQQQRPGFFYITGDEEGHTLSYSASLGKAVNVDSCC